ncbi:hypothetical protein MKX03_036116, partial [Papaver bracteatum]
MEESPWSGNIDQEQTVFNSLATAAAVPEGTSTSITVKQYLAVWDCWNLVMLNHRFQPIQLLTLLVSTRYTLLTYLDMEYKPM